MQDLSDENDRKVCEHVNRLVDAPSPYAPAPAAAAAGTGPSTPAAGAAVATPAAPQAARSIKVTAGESSAAAGGIISQNALKEMLASIPVAKETDEQRTFRIG